MKGELAAMMARHAREGRLEWIGLRSERRAAVQSVRFAEVGPDGLQGDHGRAGKRAVTLIQAEHFPVISSLAATEASPEHLRRNLVISGINLLALRNGCIRVGTVEVQIEGPCPPCSRMEETLGPGGYSAVRGHGGWYASVVTPGRIAIDDLVETVVQKGM